MKYFILLLLIFIGCEDSIFLTYPPDIIEEEERRDVYLFDEVPNLDFDENGFYHLTLDSTKWQTLHRLSGFIVDSTNSNPVENVRVEWTSSHYWYLGDTLGYMVQLGLTDDLVYVSYDTSYIVGYEGFEVPTINMVSYSNSDGEVNTMIAPVQSMVGDTMTVWYSWKGFYTEVKQDSLRIVLN